MTDILQLIKNLDPGEREFHQAVDQVIESVSRSWTAVRNTARRPFWSGSQNRSG